MRNRLIFVVSLAVLLGLVNSASADIELKVDFAYPPNLPDDPCAEAYWEATKAPEEEGWHIWADPFPFWRTFSRTDYHWLAALPEPDGQGWNVPDPAGYNGTGINVKMEVGYDGDTCFRVFDMTAGGALGVDPCGNRQLATLGCGTPR
jgi:hypothetical protein